MKDLSLHCLLNPDNFQNQFDTKEGIFERVYFVFFDLYWEDTSFDLKEGSDMSPVEALKVRYLQPRQSLPQPHRPQGPAKGNGLSLLAHFLRLRAFGTEHQAATFIADESLKIGIADPAHIQSIAGLEAIFVATPANSAVELGPYLEKVCAAIQPSISAAGSFQLTFRCGTGCEVDGKTALPIALIVGEMVLNAAKYAHPSGVPGWIEIGCYTAGHDLFVEVADDGVGLPENLDPATDGSLGFEMVRALTEQLCAETRFQSDALGLEFLLRLRK